MYSLKAACSHWTMVPHDKEQSRDQIVPCTILSFLQHIPLTNLITVLQLFRWCLVFPAEEVLSRGLHCLFVQGMLYSISTPRHWVVPPMHYTQMTFLIFIQGDVRSIQHLLAFLQDCSSTLRQGVNSEKSTYYCTQTDPRRRAFLRSLLGFQEGYAPFTYLVVPIFKGNPRREFFRNITEKVQSRLEGCQGKLLSTFGDYRWFMMLQVPYYCIHLWFIYGLLLCSIALMHGFTILFCQVLVTRKNL